MGIAMNTNIDKYIKLGKDIRTILEDGKKVDPDPKSTFNKQCEEEKGNVVDEEIKKRQEVKDKLVGFQKGILSIIGRIDASIKGQVVLRAKLGITTTAGDLKAYIPGGENDPEGRKVMSKGAKLWEEAKALHASIYSKKDSKNKVGVTDDSKEVYRHLEGETFSFSGEI